MAEDQDAKSSYKEMQKKIKEQKKAKKKARKGGKKNLKYERKMEKKRRKAMRKGFDLQAMSEVEVTAEEVTEEEFEPTPWVRKSTDDIPYLEKKIDRMAERKQSSNLHDMFEEKFGESLMTPETYKEYELSEAEKRRLEMLRAIPEESEPVAVEPVGGVAAAAETATQGEMKAEAETADPNALSFWNFKQPLWLYKKFAKDSNIIVKIIVGLISVGGTPTRYLILIILFIPRMIIKKIKGRKAKKMAAEA